jgi:hypothetical protein
LRPKSRAGLNDIPLETDFRKYLQFLGTGH